MALHLLSHVILDIFWIQVELDQEYQPPVWLQDFGVSMLQNAGNVIKLR